MRKKIIGVALSVLFVSLGFAQREETSVRKTIDTFFEAMHKGDSSLMSETLADQVTFATILRNKDGVPLLLQQETKQDLLKSIGTPRSDVYTEPIWNVVIQIDGDFAALWCDYAFYLNKTFHHCGVDAFQLFKDNDDWKIFHIADTRRKTGCDVPPDVRKKFEL